jgi:hypothetical protein
MPYDALDRKLIAPGEDGRDGKTDGDKHNKYRHRVVRKRQAIEGDIRNLQEHPGRNGVCNESAEDASTAKLLK